MLVLTRKANVSTYRVTSGYEDHCLDGYLQVCLLCRR